MLQGRDILRIGGNDIVSPMINISLWEDTDTAKELLYCNLTFVKEDRVACDLPILEKGVKYKVTVSQLMYVGETE